VVVDSVSDVVTLTPDQVKPAPDLGASVAADYLQGLGTVGERMLILLDIDNHVQQRHGADQRRRHGLSAAPF
jgi:chemotaxis signal transduction protein